MRNARSSSRLGRGVSTRPPDQALPPGTMHPPDQAPPGTRHPPCEQNYTRLWKYNLAPNSLRAVIKHDLHSKTHSVSDQLNIATLQMRLNVKWSHPA